MLKSKKLMVTALLGIYSISGFAQPREVKSPGQLCAKATGLSKGFAEYVASKMKVSMSSVRLIRASQDNSGGCSITVDTAKGPQSCIGATLYTDGKGDYWIGDTCY